MSLALESRDLSTGTAVSAVSVQARELPSGAARPVDYDAVRGWHRVNLDGVEPIVPPGGRERQNDAIERTQLVLSNPTDREQPARLLFEKTASGFRQRIGAAITGMSAVLRDAEGHPTGIPVQLSKNWHSRPEGGVYAGLWFHGFSQVRLPPQAKVELELTIAYGHWGGVAAASHAQLCLIGWGSNQLWDQSALGSWGESICYEPDQVQAQCSVLDVRPVMVRRWPPTSPGSGRTTSAAVISSACSIPAAGACLTAGCAPSTSVRPVPDGGDLRGLLWRWSRTFRHGQPRPHRRRGAGHVPSAAGREAGHRLLAVRHLPDRGGYLQLHRRTQDGAGQRDRPDPRVADAVGR